MANDECANRESINESSDLGVELLALLALAGVWAFVFISHGISRESFQRFDERLLLACRDPADISRTIGPAWMTEVVRDFTAVGGVAVLTLVTFAVSGFLVIRGKYRATVLLLAATLGGLALSTVLKNVFDRPRPEVVPHLSYVTSSSFPSGHSMLAAVVYLTLGSMLARLERSPWIKAYIISMSMLLVVLVGTSRVFVGVHFPTDVLGGWSAGVAWALACSLVAQRLQKRGEVDA